MGSPLSTGEAGDMWRDSPGRDSDGQLSRELHRALCSDPERMKQPIVEHITESPHPFHLALAGIDGGYVVTAQRKGMLGRLRSWHVRVTSELEGRVLLSEIAHAVTSGRFSGWRFGLSVPDAAIVARGLS